MMFDFLCENLNFLDENLDFLYKYITDFFYEKSL